MEIELIGRIPNVHLGLKSLVAFLAVLPITGMTFMKVGCTECVSIVISVAAIVSIGERNILVLIIADPVATAGGFRKILALAA